MKSFTDKQGRSEEKDHRALRDGVSLEGFLVEVKWRGEGRFCSEGNGLPITRVIHLEEKLGVSLHFQNLES